MTISDLLTLIGILLATIAILSERNREYIILKLTNIEIWVIVILFLHIHFLLSYDWWIEKFTFLNITQKEGFPMPNAWAYLFSIGILTYCIWKIFFGKFPLSKKEKLLLYYKKLLYKNDISLLIQLIEKYHLTQIILFLRKKKAIKVEKKAGVQRLDLENYSKEYERVIKGSELIYGKIIYHNIILNDFFIDYVANLNPYLFSQIIKELDVIELKDDDFVNRYLKVLMINKNGNFFREIRNNLNLGQFDGYLIDTDRPILYALFNNIIVCSINQAWRGVAEPAILEIHEEAKKDYSVLRESDREQESDTTWTFRITVAIWYFDIMVRQAIIQNVSDHMWMYYYEHFVAGLISNMQELPFLSSDLNRRSRNFDLIEMIFSKMMDWKTVIIKSKNNALSKCVYDCIGRCIYKLVTTDKLRQEDKNYLINWVWEDLIKSFGEDEKSTEISNEIIQLGFDMFKNPSMLFTLDPRFTNSESQMYLTALETLWRNRDTPILTGILEERAINFQTLVINELLQ